MEVLGRMIDDAVERKPLKPARGGPDISHLFFADDLGASTS